MREGYETAEVVIEFRCNCGETMTAALWTGDEADGPVCRKCGTEYAVKRPRIKRAPA